MKKPSEDRAQEVIFEEEVIPPNVRITKALTGSRSRSLFEGEFEPEPKRPYKYTPCLS
jgi:hypothetical protein